MVNEIHKSNRLKPKSKKREVSKVTSRRETLGRGEAEELYMDPYGFIKTMLFELSVVSSVAQLIL